jgi:tRNA/rRNA methyltransferase
VPVGPHITDFVSFPLKCVIDLVPPQESVEAQAGRADKRAYLEERGYRVVEVRAAEVEQETAEALDRLATAIG